MSSVRQQPSRVLVFRSCRQAQLRAAIEAARARYPGAEIWVLAHGDFVRATADDGADRVIVHYASRLGLLNLPVALVLALRRHRFAAVVVPQMTSDTIAAANLYRFAWCIAAREALVVVAGEDPRAYARARLGSLALRSTLFGSPQGWVTLALLVRALAHRRLRPPAARPAQGRPRVLHVIDNLGMGGAQVQLAELLNQTPTGGHEVEVLALSAGSTFSGHRLTRSVPIRWLDDGLGTSARILATLDHCRAGRYDVVHTWLFGSNIVGATAAALADVPRIITSVRSLNPGHYPQQLQWWHRLADALASRIADVVTVNTGVLVADHSRWALIPKRRIRVVHNGIDPAPLEAARAGAREWLRRELGLPPDAVVIGTVGRLAVEKDHATFIRTAAHMVGAGFDVHAVVAGEGPLREALGTLAQGAGLSSNRLHWMGARTDARRVIAGMDVFVLSSRIEGFPNALLEAAMLGVPCVSSAVGGVPDVIGLTDDLFPPGDHLAAAGIVERKLDRARARIEATVIRERCHRLFTARHVRERWHKAYGWEAAA